VLLVLTLAGTLWPAWRSLRVEPMAVLREE
jgi:ABC-type lipoprotein release transport system permease subunit